jgi:5-methylcytosine-specific restriction endonuclease McrA
VRSLLGDVEENFITLCNVCHLQATSNSHGLLRGKSRTECPASSLELKFHSNGTGGKPFH